MPAVDPVRLRRQTESVVAATADPEALARTLLDVLEFYRDRTRRAASASTGRGASPRVRVLGAPTPVLRALARGLGEALAGDQERALVAATVLWQTGVEEAMSLAAASLSGHAGHEVTEWITVHARGCESRRALADLALDGLAGLRGEAPGALIRQAGIWLRSGEDRLQALALHGLAILASGTAFDDLPAIYRLLESAPLDARGVSQAALEKVVGILARRSPMETARFLSDRLARGQPGAERVLRRTLSAFPLRQRQALERTLSVLPRAGIIRPS
jgi:hypothetical protein